MPDLLFQLGDLAPPHINGFRRIVELRHSRGNLSVLRTRLVQRSNGNAQNLADSDRLIKLQRPDALLHVGDDLLLKRQPAQRKLMSEQGLRLVGRLP
jgi:hypothetical protein